MQNDEKWLFQALWKIWVNGDDDIPNWMEQKNAKPPTSIGDRTGSYGDDNGDTSSSSSYSSPPLPADFAVGLAWGLVIIL